MSEVPRVVIGTGAPASAAGIFRELAESHPGTALDEIVTRFRERDDPDWTMAAQVIEQMMRTQQAKDVRELRNWASKVGRFLLSSPDAVRLQAASHPSSTTRAESGSHVPSPR